MRAVGGIVVIVGCSLLASCADTPPAPVEDRSATGRQSTARPKTYESALRPGKPYTVRRGDTLYSIAFRLGMDFKALARRNAIRAPYTIFPGQVLATDLRSGSTAAKKPAKQSPSASNNARTSQPKPKTVTSPKAPSKTTPKTTPNAPKPDATAVTVPKRKVGSVGNKPVSRWRWPSAGRVTRGYSNNLHKGIDIAGTRGAPVRVVAAGSVVYAGTGVTGYGALIIVKHNEDYLSAYGHNDRLLVEEGEQVAAGQEIAKMGSTGTDTVKLHFEIRRRGQPVDPLKILPKR
ncbi:MAG: peptidoglycan DD-metalloendopeptidase family protein [Halieaceae bacterium]|jgi:lipoprotein NlpD|nr:peptidoglycan DD-metalloendopeptidase family protein [Halieaceae bacterium]